MVSPVSRSVWWRRSIVVRLPTDYLVRGVLLPLVALFVFSTARLTLGAGYDVQSAAAIVIYVGWCFVPLVLALRKRRPLEYLIRAELGEPLCTWCGYRRDPALADAPCPECGRLPEPLTDTRRRVYAIARWVPSLTTVDSHALEGELRRFLRSERVVFWPRLIGVTIGFVLLTFSLLVTAEILQDRYPRANLRPFVWVLVGVMPMMFVGTVFLLRLRRLLRWMQKWTPDDARAEGAVDD